MASSTGLQDIIGLGMNLDLSEFWTENALCEGKAFRTDKPRCPIALPVDDHWLLDEMGEKSTLRYFRDAEYAADLNRRCNDRCEEQLGMRPFRDTPAPKPPLRIEHLFGSRTELTENGTPWLEPGITSPAELARKLDGIEKTSEAELRELIFSNGGRVERDAVATSVEKNVVGAYSRGPATIATSVIGTTETMYWLVDESTLMERFFRALAETIVRYQRIIERKRGVVFKGYGFLDDNCALLSPPLYEKFCYPVLQRVFEEFAPQEGEGRYQHSDSAMGHLLPALSRLHFHAVNFGPTIPAEEIRRHMPRTEIHGQVAPMTLRNGRAEEIIAEVKRDFSAVGADGGLLVTTAGSIAAGTSFQNIRTLMWAVREFTRY